jgi:phage-related protein
MAAGTVRYAPSAAENGPKGPTCVHVLFKVQKLGGSTVPNRAQLPVFFYRTMGGAEPVRDWLKQLPGRLQVGWPIGMPLCRSLGNGLWELRSALPSSRIARLLFFVEDGEILVVHGFIKKTQKTAAADIARAMRRMKEARE